tara:strand:- start:190 stop:1212 length:1023 start_codon:yes stop_codon:yes gene_type:complete
MKTLITGSAGFIGFHLSKKLLEKGVPVIGIDNLNSYYDPKLKESRLSKLEEISINSKTPFTFIKASIENDIDLENAFNLYKPNKVIHLAAQAGVRYSIENPSSYIQSNLVGFGNILEGCRKQKVEHLIYASSSSVYGGNTNLPFNENQGVDHPISLYAATKKSNELMAHSYSHLYNLPITGVRFFTIYGPWGRPDMALFLFTKAMLENKPIKVFNQGEMFRDFTYIKDSIECLIRLLEKPPIAESSFNRSIPNPSTSWAPYRIFNLGNSNPIPISLLIRILEKKLNVTAKKDLLPIQPGDVVSTAADNNALKEWIGIAPRTPIEVGVEEFVNWYRSYYDY